MIAYKYRTFVSEYQAVEALRDNQLYAAPVSQLNDVFEASFIDDTFLQQMKAIKERFLYDTSDIESKWKSLKEATQRAGIYSLAKSKKDYPDNLSMWSTYADSNRGFCIGYDIDKLIDREKYLFNVSKVDVEYTTQKPMIELEDVHSHKLYTKMLATKRIDFEKECEIRLIYNTAGVKTYHPSALKSVYLGARIQQKDKELLLAALEGKDVSIYQMMASDEDYALYPKLIVENKRHIDDVLDKSEYEILATNHSHVVENFHVLYKRANKDEKSIIQFISKFQEMFATKQANIYVFSHPLPGNLYTKYPMTDEEQQMFDRFLIAEMQIGFEEPVIHC